MTREQIAKLSDDELRVKVAELCGAEMPIHIPPTMGAIRNGTLFVNLPDYPSDLNAMHEAEKLLAEGDKHYKIGIEVSPTSNYGQLLIELTNRTNPFHATARQRAEAFVSTMQAPTSDASSMREIVAAFVGLRV